MSHIPSPAGNFLRSSTFLIIVIGNLVFSSVFILSLGAHIAKPANQQTEQTAEEKQPAVKTQSVVTLANIQ